MANSVTASLPNEIIQTVDQVAAEERAGAILTTSITPEQIPEALNHYLSRTREKPDVAVAIWGKVGIGKTSGIRAYARSNGYRLVIIHLQLYDPSDLKGIPVKMDDGEVRWVNTSYLPQQTTRRIELSKNDDEQIINLNWIHAEQIVATFPDDINAALSVEWQVLGPRQIRVKLRPGVNSFSGVLHVKEKALIFLDEISTANTDVQNAALSLVLDRRAGEYELPNTCRIVAAGNTEEDGAFVNPISFALANRFLHMTLRPSVPGFLNYAMTHFGSENRHIMISFLNMWGAEYLHRFNPDTLKGGNYGAPTPRTWEMWCQQYNINHPVWLRRNTTIGLLGSDTAARLMAFLSMTETLPNPMDILEGHNYTWKTTDRITGLMMIGLLVTRLREVFDNCKSRMQGLRDDELIVDVNKQPKEWITALDGIFGFMNKHLTDDARTAGYFMIIDIAKIPSSVLHGAQFKEFCVSSVRIVRAINASIT